MSVKTIKFFDKYVGSLFCGLLGFFSKRKSMNHRNILAIQLWGVGESILTLPAIKGLKKRFPDSKIYVLATSEVKDVFTGNKDIEKVIIIKTNIANILKFIFGNYRKFNLVVDFEEYLNISSIISFFAGKYRIGFSHGVRSRIYNKKVVYNDRQHVVQTFLDLVKSVGVEYNTGQLVKLSVGEEDKIFIEDFFKNKITKKDFIAGIAPGTSESAKSRAWAKENFAVLADKLVEKYKAKIIFIGGPKERDLIVKIQNMMKHKSINSAGTNVRQLFYLIEKCNLIISNDTGPMHIGAAQGVRTVGLFGPNLPARFAPYGRKNASVYKGAECSPCINVHLGQVPECRWKGKDYQKCMKKIKVEDVLLGVRKIL